MLFALKIENIAVIESAELEFDAGLNVLTGETGAGKSIIIDAINAVLGERTSRELVRTGAESAKVRAFFTEIDAETERLLEEAGIGKTPDKTLVISRSLWTSGRNVCRANGFPISVSELKKIGSALISIYGQNDGKALLSPENHCGFIDELAGNDAARGEYKGVFTELLSVKRELEALYDARDEKASRLDYLNFQIEEITSANARRGEREELAKEKELLQNGGAVLKSLKTAYALLNDEKGALESLNECAALVEKAARYFEKASGEAREIRSAAYELSDVASRIGKLAEELDFDPARLAEIDERLDFLYRLSLKYGVDEGDILEYLDKAKAEKSEIEFSDGKINALEDKLYLLSDRIKALAAALTESRTKAARKLEKKVKSELEFLDMPKVEFKAERRETALTSRGADAMEFFIGANPGQEAKPIAKIASGGELSRIMLAIKNALAEKNPVKTLIFDEIDSGVSGSAARKVALKLAQAAKNGQVICVTHLAPVAAYADKHMRVLKSVENGKTFTRIKPLDFKERAEEIARISGGGRITDLQLKAAEELLSNAKKEETT